MLRQKNSLIWLAGLGTLMLALLLLESGCGDAGASAAGADRAIPEGTSQGQAQVLDLGNATCPVMGAPVAAGNYADWNGFRIHFCCGGCDGTFLRDPGRYLPALLGDESIAPSARESLRQYCSASGIPVGGSPGTAGQPGGGS